MNTHKTIMVLGMFLFISISFFGQQKERVDLSNKFKNQKINAVNRTLSLYDDHKDALEMNAEDADGLGILEDIEFSKGTIEVELLGENNPGKSFIGIAFNIQNEETYEVIYFRPFNFVADEQIRKDHMVQYVFHPEFTWRKLREERTGEFENEISEPPNPDAWFKARIKITNKKVEVYVDEIAEPVLSVDRLTSIRSNKIGVWAGFGSSGRYKNLVLQAK